MTSVEMRGEQLAWRVWWGLAVVYGLGTLLGMIVFGEQRPALAMLYPLGMWWLAATRERDLALRWFPVFYVTGGALILASPFPTDTPAGFALQATLLAGWLLVLSKTSRRLARRS